jgi:ribonuclease D
MGLNITRDKLCTVQFCDELGASYIVQFTEEYNAPNLSKILSNTETTKIFHFARFDIAIIKYYLKTDITNIFCTKIASRLVRTYSDSHGLKELCRELLGIQISKQQQSSDWGALTLSSDQQDYAISDVIHLHKLKEILTNMLTRENRFDIANRLFKFLPTRAELDIMGWNDIDILAHS